MLNILVALRSLSEIVGKNHFLGGYIWKLQMKMGANTHQKLKVQGEGLVLGQTEQVPMPKFYFIKMKQSSYLTLAKSGETIIAKNVN